MLLEKGVSNYYFQCQAVIPSKQTVFISYKYMYHVSWTSLKNERFRRPSADAQRARSVFAQIWHLRHSTIPSRLDHYSLASAHTFVVWLSSRATGTPRHTPTAYRTKLDLTAPYSQCSKHVQLGSHRRGRVVNLVGLRYRGTSTTHFTVQLPLSPISIVYEEYPPLKLAYLAPCSRTSGLRP